MFDLPDRNSPQKKMTDYLAQELWLRRVCYRPLCRNIIQATAQEQDVAVTPSELQAEAERMQRQFALEGLETATQVMQWLYEQFTLADHWEDNLNTYLLLDKLADQLFGGDVKQEFSRQRQHYLQAELYRIVVPYARIAQELVYRIGESEISFFEAAHLYDIDARRRLHCGYEGRVARWQLQPELSTRLFNARLQTVLGPVKSERGYELLWVDELIEPELTEAVYTEIRDRMFQEWLEAELKKLQS
jgi:parvulin-like peptidyl-prolyl isomerase